MAANGKIPLSELTPIGLSVEGKQQYLTARTAFYLLLMAAAYLRDTGQTMRWWEAYRSYAEQERIFRERYYVSATGAVRWNGQRWTKRPGVAVAAVPGTSNHGLGSTLDFFMTNQLLDWLRKNARKYGFTNVEGASVGENWHWVLAVTPSVPGTVPAGGGNTVPLPATEDYEEEYSMNTIYLVTDQPTINGDCGVFGGWTYIKDSATGISRPLSTQEYQDEMVAHPKTVVIRYNGNDFVALVKKLGMEEFWVVNGQPAGLTGRLIGRSADGNNRNGSSFTHWPRTMVGGAVPGLD